MIGPTGGDPVEYQDGAISPGRDRDPSPWATGVTGGRTPARSSRRDQIQLPRPPVERPALQPPLKVHLSPGHQVFAATKAFDASAIRAVLRANGDRAAYWDDFGDDWYHDVLLESVLPANAVAHPVCVGGRRAGPLEDSGGIHSYQQMCAALADAGHPDHAAGRQWLEQVNGWIGWDPSHIDRAELNRRLAEIVLPEG